MELRPLGGTGIEVSVLGLGTVKLGRDQGVKYPEPFRIPDDAGVSRLLATAGELGINLLDTAPAYGSSEERIGRLLPGPRDRWVIVSKVGETFEDGVSRFDFSAAATRRSVEESLRLLRTDYLDLVLIHSNGDDLDILDRDEVLDALVRLRHEGLIRALGMSSKTVAGGLRAVACCDVVMATLSLAQRDELPVIRAAHAAGKGVLVKKGLQSGHFAAAGGGVTEAMRFVLAQPGVSSLIVGTINPEHLRENARAARMAAPKGE